LEGLLHEKAVRVAKTLARCIIDTNIAK